MTLKLDKAFMIGAMVGLLATVTFLAIWVYQLKPQTVKGSAPTGYQAVTGSSSQITLASFETLQIFASSTCVSRIISPNGTNTTRILFADSVDRPSAGVGHLLVASSTNMFDSGLYGCGLWRAFNQSGSSSIFTITEFSNFK